MATPSLILGNGNWAVKSDSLLGYALPQGKYTPREFTVTRATTATRVNETGLVRLVPYNLVFWSEMFSDASWTKANSTLDPNTIIAPDGKLTADKLIETATSGFHYATQSTGVVTLGATITTSVFVKSAERTYFGLYPYNSSAGVKFNLNTGVILSQDAGIVSASITSVGNGWYKISASIIAIGTTPAPWFALLNNSGATSYAGDGTSGLFIWGAQLVEGTNPLTYLPTTTRLNIPRVDYLLGSANLLLEPQRTNIALRSQEFDNATWQQGNSSITANSTISPSGIQNADTLVENNTSGTHSIVQSVTVTAIVYTFSFYAKPNGRNFVQWTNAVNTDYCNFDIVTGAIGNSQNVTGASAQSVGNGWYRCSFQYTPTASTTNWFRISLITSNTAPRLESYLGDGVSGAYLWGAQLEAGAYATSYIPTTTASITRNGDTITKSNVFTNGYITSAGGTWFVELRGNVPRIRDLSSQFWLGDTASTSLVNAFTFRGQTSSSRLTISKVVAATTTTVFTTTTDTVKVAIKWNGSTADVFVNGVKVVTATAFTTTNMEFLNCFAADVPKYINQMALYTTPLTDPELISLTTL